MKEEVINGIAYCLDEDNLTAEVIQDEEIHEGDIIIPETIVFDGKTYRVTSIGDSAFSYCGSLTSIVIPEGVESIGFSAFEYCEKLTSITIPSNVTRIGNYAFFDCDRLNAIIIPDSVTSIGDSAFAGCVSLFLFVFKGTIAQWKEIELGDNWNNEVFPTKLVHCIDGDVRG